MLSKLAYLSRAASQRASSLSMVQLPQRSFIDQITQNSLHIEGSQVVPFDKGQVAFWQEQAKNQQTALVLKDRDQIEKYVISLIKSYFRTTTKQKVSLNSDLADHGLDDYDQIELLIQLEDELGYVVDAENLGKFKKPKHFVNFILQMEAYKTEFHKLPTDEIHYSTSFKELFPGIPFITAKGGHWEHESWKKYG